MHIDEVRGEEGKERNKRQQVRHQRNSQTQHQHPNSQLAVTVYPHHADREQLNEQQDGILAHRCRRVADIHLSIADAHDEVNHHRHASKQDAAWHTLAIEHQEESQIDQCRTRFALEHDKHHRQQDDQQGGGKMTPLADVVAVDRHQLGLRQRGGKLRKLSGLQAQRSQHQPRARALDTMRIKDSGKEQ